MKKKKIKASAKKQVIKDKKEIDDFFAKHIKNTSDHTTLVLKFHLYVEHCLDEIFLTTFPDPNKMIKKTFSNKIDLFEALRLYDPPDNKEIVVKLRQLNKIRNSFVHNLNKELNKDDIASFVRDIKLNENMPIEEKFKIGIMHFIGYLSAHISINRHLPFFSSYFRNKNMYKKDIGWNDSIITNYPIQYVKELFRYLRIKIMP